ncbi:hypothetical protein ACIBKY_51190 [Nonomuraea sp. NPDC050394]|uniref:hypothetical protein n=1 Tax=Nonomuraea sp. NPDC050394 TaxID=3364363 RepID=UPI003798A714
MSLWDIVDGVLWGILGMISCFLYLTGRFRRVVQDAGRQLIHAFSIADDERERHEVTKRREASYADAMTAIAAIDAGDAGGLAQAQQLAARALEGGDYQGRMRALQAALALEVDDNAGLREALAAVHRVHSGEAGQ